MNYTEVFTFRKPRNSTSSSEGQKTVDVLAEPSNNNRKLQIGEFLPDYDDYTSSSDLRPEDIVPDDEVVFKNPDGKVVTKVSYNSNWKKKGSSKKEVVWPKGKRKGKGRSKGKRSGKKGRGREEGKGKER